MPTRPLDATASSYRPAARRAGVIGCAMAHRANKIAYAMVRDQSGYDPDRWA
jgi:hypothetical protein